MRVVVTGGSGRLGQYVVRELFTHAHQVSSLDSIKPRECPAPTYTVDLSKFHALTEHFKNADAVIHLARIRFPYTETVLMWRRRSGGLPISPATPSASIKTWRLPIMFSLLPNPLA